MTHLVLRLVKRSVEGSQADNTEEISMEVRRLLTNRSYFYRRFADAYPEVIYRTDRVKQRLAAVKAVEVQYVNQTFEGDRLPIYACGENRYSIRKDGQLAMNCSFCLAAETKTTE